MKDRRWTFMIAILLALGILTFWAGLAQALHKSAGPGKLECERCHAMHQAQGDDGAFGGTPEYYNQWEAWGTGQNADSNYGRRLLKTRRSSTLCLQCHDAGTVAANPGTGRDSEGRYVVDTSRVGDNGKPATVAAGGYFYGMTTMPQINTGGFDSSHAHAVDKYTSVPASHNAGWPKNFWCRDCHHHHGTYQSDTHAGDLPNGDPFKGGSMKISAFRNLIVPEGDNNVVGREISGTDTSYTKGLELFCTRCHDLADDGAANGYHPVGIGTRIKDGAHTAGTNYESGMDDTDTITLQPIIKPQDPSGTDNRIAEVPDPGDDDEVTCLTCHYAHGGPYDKMLRWDYGNSSYTWNEGTIRTTGVGRDDSGKVMDAGAGCQMCHGM